MTRMTFRVKKLKLAKETSYQVTYTIALTECKKGTPEIQKGHVAQSLGEDFGCFRGSATGTGPVTGSNERYMYSQEA